MAHPDLDAIVDVLAPFAQKMLSRHGEFHPFAASTDSDGEVRMVAIDDGDEHPLAQHRIEQYIELFKAEAVAKRVRAAGICYDARVIPPGATEKTDAVAFSLEHESGEALDVFLPYLRADPEVEYGDMFAFIRSPTIFST